MANTPNNGFLASLAALDSLLSVRWGDFVGQWVIERVAYIYPGEIGYMERRMERLRRLINRKNGQKRDHYLSQWRQLHEELLAAKAGKRVILIVPELNARVYDMLCASDMQKYGGYARIADEIEAREAAEEARQERTLEDERRVISSEVYSMLNFIWRKRETALLHGEQNMGMLLHGKRSTQPVIQLAG